MSELTGGLSRSELPSTHALTKKDPTWLSSELETQIDKKLALRKKKVVVITGMRETEVHHYLGERYDLYAFELVCPAPLRYQRLLFLRKIRRAKEFIEQELGEVAMGTQDVMDAAPFRVPTDNETLPDFVVRAILRALSVKGAPLK